MCAYLFDVAALTLQCYFLVAGRGRGACARVAILGTTMPAGQSVWAFSFARQRLFSSLCAVYPCTITTITTRFGCASLCCRRRSCCCCCCFALLAHDNIVELPTRKIHLEVAAVTVYAKQQITARTVAAMAVLGFALMRAAAGSRQAA